MRIGEITLTGPDVKTHIIEFLQKKYSKCQFYDLPDTYIFMYEQWGEFIESSFQLSFIIEKQDEDSILLHIVGAGLAEPRDVIGMVNKILGSGVITKEIINVHKELINYMSYRNIKVGELDLMTKNFMD